VVGCADRFAEAHRASVERLLAERRSPAHKLRRYVEERHREWLEVGVRAPHAAELAEAVLRLRPERTIDYAREFENTVRALLEEGARRDLPFADPERDAPLFALALSPFFPVAGREHPALPSPERLKAVLAWFLLLWKQGRAPQRRRP
jgi:hypothetical protein